MFLDRRDVRDRATTGLSDFVSASFAMLPMDGMAIATSNADRVRLSVFRPVRRAIRLIMKVAIAEDLSVKGANFMSASPVSVESAAPVAKSAPPKTDEASASPREAAR